MKAVTIRIVDDKAQVRQSLRWLLESVDLNVEEYAQAESCLEQLDPDLPGCVLLDIRMPGMGGPALQQVLQQRAPELPVIFMTGHGDVGLAVRAMKSGAFDFFEKPYNDQLLLETVHNALELNAHLLDQRRYTVGLAERHAHLTARERDVLAGLLRGLGSKQLAAELNISVKTVDVHRHNLMQKMRADNLAQLFSICAELGLLPPPTDLN
jgi:FixJ family two-component response regulator